MGNSSSERFSYPVAKTIIDPKIGPRAKVEVGYNLPRAWGVKMISGKRKRHSAQFKFKVALEAAKGRDFYLGNNP